MERGRPRLGAVVRSAGALLLAASLAAGCATTPEAGRTGDDAGRLKAEDAAAREAFVALVSEHNERVSRLGSFESRASIEARWKTGDRERFERCDGDIFLAPEGRGAVRLSVVSQNLAWIGGDGQRAWIFNVEARPPTAVVFERLADPAWSRTGLLPGTEGLGVLAPGSVRQLAGFAPIPAESAVERAPDAFDAAPGQPWGRHEVRYEIAPALRVAVAFGPDRLPARLRVETLEGGEVMRSQLSEYLRARAENLAIGAWPSVPRKIELVAAAGTATVSVFLDEPSAQAKRMNPRLFSLEDLLATLRPDSVEYRMPPEPPVAGEHAGEDADEGAGG